MTIDLERTNVPEPVKVSLSQLPEGVSAQEASRSTGTESVEFQLRAADDADLVENHATFLSVEGPVGMRATEYIPLTVTDETWLGLGGPKPRADKPDGGESGAPRRRKAVVEDSQARRLALEPPEAVALRRGQSAEVVLQIERTQLSGPVEVEFTDLPDGVKIAEEDPQILAARATFRLEAKESANPVSHWAKVMVRSPDADIGVGQRFRITVEK